jgi:hypothetical protein
MIMWQMKSHCSACTECGRQLFSRSPAKKSKLNFTLLTLISSISYWSFRSLFYLFCFFITLIILFLLLMLPVKPAFPFNLLLFASYNKILPCHLKPLLSYSFHFIIRISSTTLCFCWYSHTQFSLKAEADSILSNYSTGTQQFIGTCTKIYQLERNPSYRCLE